MLPPFGWAFKNALSEQGYKSWGGGDYPEPSLFVRVGYQWVGYSLFDANNNLQRNAADALLEALPNLTVKTRHTARVSNTAEPLIDGSHLLALWLVLLQSDRAGLSRCHHLAEMLLYS